MAPHGFGKGCLLAFIVVSIVGQIGKLRDDLVKNGFFVDLPEPGMKRE
ncbi:MAG: hypothetical protein AWU57_1425, partial [Marinobacter sp. T13-3]